jgi:hypothetical protein
MSSKVEDEEINFMLNIKMLSNFTELKSLKRMRK